MNLFFFKMAMIVYLVSGIGYITFIIKPEFKRIATVSLWAAFAGFVLHLAYFSFRWSEAGRIPITSLSVASSSASRSSA